ncbi:MAG TPA: HAD hydrolase-like protein [Holophagaceae bacterium]|jgi:phosphoglycolate phosphatase-like HAD superfamily hydrolase|nr:HAD hydrolase-like protein [Holophagaceae bacterium]
MPLCFDLDGTLGSFGGGYLLLRETLAELWGTPVEKAELDACAGSTDWEIVDELHRARFGRGLEDDGYSAFESACLAKFRATFHPAGRAPLPHMGLIEGLGILLDRGHGVWLVSGNSPSVLDFKAEALKLDPRIPLLGSLPRHDRADLIRRALGGGPGPHLYAGDRPHDREAAAQAGVPFLAVGDAAPGDHPVLAPHAEAEALVDAVEMLLA